MLKGCRKAQLEDLITILIVVGASFAILMVISTVMYKASIEAVGALNERIKSVYPNPALRALSYSVAPPFHNPPDNPRLEMSNAKLTAAAVYHLDTQKPFYIPYGDTRINVSDILNETIREMINETLTVAVYELSATYRDNTVLRLQSGKISRPVSGSLRIPVLFSDPEKFIGLNLTAPL